MNHIDIVIDKSNIQIIVQRIVKIIQKKKKLRKLFTHEIIKCCFYRH